MNAHEPVQVKVVYSAGGRSRRRGRAGGRGSTRLLAALAGLNVVVAVVIYVVVWQWADPRLRPLWLLHTPLVGVELEDVDVTIPPKRGVQRGTPVAPDTNGTEARAAGQMAETARFLAPTIGWEVVSTIGAAGLLLAAGALSSRIGRGVRLATVILATVGAGILVWWVGRAWPDHGEPTPAQIRLLVAAGLLGALMVGAAIGRAARGMSYLAALALIVSGIGSAYVIDVLVEFHALDRAALPTSLNATMAMAFVAHSLWGWLLFPLARRV